jgi:hydrogenase large subunit
MPEVFIPLAARNAGTTIAPPPQEKRIVIDPITRIEGHLRIEIQVTNGVVTDAWSSSTMFRGIEMILKNRDPREAWVFAQRICGVCTTVHAIASVRAVENALGIPVPENAQLLRNLIEGAQFVQDHVIHFYHLHALDWVDIVSALSADPSATSKLARAISDWPNSSAEYFSTVKARLANFVSSGQLGLFANAYWGHPAYKLPPEVNLMAVAHYLEALDWQHEYIKIHALLGGKNPHPQTYLVGGMAMPVDPDSSVAINQQRITQLRAWSTQALEFVSKVYLPDLKAVASFYPEWTQLGRGPANFLSFGDFPERWTTGTDADPSSPFGGDLSSLWLQRGAVWNGNISAPPDPLDHQHIQEFVTHSWYAYADGNNTGKHPWDGETTPNFTGPQPPFDYLETENKYSWLKAPRYNGAPMEVGPLARMIVAYAAGHPRVRQEVNAVLNSLNLPPSALFSTLGRVAARGIETLLIAERMQSWIDRLEVNMEGGNRQIHNGVRWNPSTWPSEAIGWGTTEAPRGALGHWVKIKNGKIDNYQTVVPTTWNGSPRDAQGQRGVWEQALIGTPVPDPTQPVEILRTIHSFDPCMACSVHVIDTVNQQVTRIEVVP